MPALLLTMTLCLAAADPADRSCVLIVVGAPGAPEYGAEFRRWAGLWRAAAEKGGAESITIGEAEGDGADRDALKQAIADKGTAGREPLWIVLIGHGTFDGREPKFNLRGPDVAAAELAEWLKPIQRPLAVVNCASSSGPFINALSGADRVVATATRSGDEQNFARLGQYLAEAIADSAADLDKDGQVSLLEAFLTASARTQEFYRSKARLATEHALIDDDGDKLGTPADWFRGVHATKRVKSGATADGARAHQLHLIKNDREQRMSPEVRDRRDQLERAASDLRATKGAIPDDAYYHRLEKIMVDLARLYRDSSPEDGR